ncbi:MAG: hypothetical protein ACRCX4_05725 [Bacteroidales bacterium]
MTQLKYISTLILTGVILIFGLGITLQHLNCKCRFVPDNMHSSVQTAHASDCCHSLPASSETDSSTAENCNCAVSFCQTELNDETLISSSSSCSSLTMLSFIFTLLLLLRKPLLLSSRSVSSSKCRIASGRERLSLHAILII